MNGKSQVILYWGLALIVLSGVARGDWQSLYTEVTSGQGTAASGLFWRLIGEGLFLAILVGISMTSDDGASAGLAIEAALTIVFLFSNQQVVNQILGTLLSGNYAAGQAPGAGGGPGVHTNTKKTGGK